MGNRRIRFAAIGGFLGAGKTTLLAAAAQEVRERGIRIGLVTNDQGHDLVDSQSLRAKDLPVAQVVGGCFCCRFDDLVVGARELIDNAGVQIVFTEPVGSCTDLVATVYRPLAQFYGEEFELAPFTVLADPQRLADLALPGRGGFSHRVEKLFLWQLQEADILALSKADTVDREVVRRLTEKLGQINPRASIMSISGVSGEGVDQWLEAVLTQRATNSARLEVDYDLYAQAEAELGWLNATVVLGGEQEFELPEVLQDILADINASCVQIGAPVAHLKASSSCVGCPPVVGSVTRTGQNPNLSTEAGCLAKAGELLINARVGVEPEKLRQVVHAAVESVCSERGLHFRFTGEQCFKPSPPEPTHRIIAPLTR